MFPKTFLSAEVVGKFSAYIHNPFSALGLLIDNSLNLSSSIIELNFCKFEIENE
jgi:hypothetical protein